MLPLGYRTEGRNLEPIAFENSGFALNGEDGGVSGVSVDAPPSPYVQGRQIQWVRRIAAQIRTAQRGYGKIAPDPVNRCNGAGAIKQLRPGTGTSSDASSRDDVHAAASRQLLRCPENHPGARPPLSTPGWSAESLAEDTAKAQR